MTEQTVKRGRPSKEAQTEKQIAHLQNCIDSHNAQLTQVAEQITTLSNQVDRLTRAMGKFAHYNGGMNPGICKEFNIPVFEPGRKEMHRHV